MVIRRAEADDKMRVLLMAKAFHAAADVPFPFSPAHADAIFRASLEAEDRLCLVLDVDGMAQGVLVAEAGPHPFGPFKVASELIWWIEPSFRGRFATAMIAQYETWAKGQGCSFAHLVGLGEDPAAGRLYQRRGFRAAERHFVKSF